MYGGLAPNPFSCKPRTEYVAVPRDGDLRKKITIPPGADLQVTRGLVSVFFLLNLLQPSSLPPPTTTTTTTTRYNYSTHATTPWRSPSFSLLSSQVDSYISEGPVDLTISYTTSRCPDAIIVQDRTTLSPLQDGEPKRFLVVTPPYSGDEERVFTVTWSNSNWMSQRMMVYSLTPVASTGTESNGNDGSNPSKTRSTSSSRTGTPEPKKKNLHSPKLNTPHSLVLDPPGYKIITLEGRVIQQEEPFLRGLFQF